MCLVPYADEHQHALGYLLIVYAEVNGPMACDGEGRVGARYGNSRVREGRDALCGLYLQRATDFREHAELVARFRASIFGYGDEKGVRELDGYENETLKNEIDCAHGKSLDVNVYAD